MMDMYNFMCVIMDINHVIMEVHDSNMDILNLIHGDPNCYYG